jgi:hypothetical protein
MLNFIELRRKTCIILFIVLLLAIVITIIIINDFHYKVYHDTLYYFMYKDFNQINYDSLTWISTKEGISSHFFQLQTMFFDRISKI